MIPVPWQPRPSSMGRAILCDFSALLDRLIYEGKIPVTAEELADMKAGNQYTAMGTLAHFYLMDGAGCEFAGPSADYAPTPEEEKMAAGWTGGDIPAARLKARKVATLAAKYLPLAKDGKPWRSEVEFNKNGEAPAIPFSGTIDFLSHDFTEIGDLKTASKPPVGGRIHIKYLIQVVCYAHLVEKITGVHVKTGWILYVSSKGDWVMPPIPIDFDQLGDYTGMVVRAAKYLTSPMIFDVAMPRLLDSQCGEVYCPHISRCRDLIRPEPGKLISTTEAKQITRKDPFK